MIYKEPTKYQTTLLSQIILFQQLSVRLPYLIFQNSILQFKMQLSFIQLSLETIINYPLIIAQLQMDRKQKFNQKYIEGELLGKGKAGIVYKVQKKIKSQSQSSSSSRKDPQPKFYAAKHISLSKIDLQVARKQLKILEQLKHMYIVRFYEDFIENDELILIMDYCEGKDLQFLIQQMKKKGKYFNESLVSTWIFQLIMVVEYIHSCNIIHRDIKPQNIFVDQDMNLKIGDFGVSKLLQGTENCKTTAGTPLYFSPEVIKGQNYSKKTDIWSLGCVIHEICTLQKPFTAKTGLLELMNVIQTHEPKNIPKIYSSDLNKLIRKMLAKDSKKRPTSRQLLQDPILVQLMINYSSQVNLKQQYENKPIEKPTLTQSFIEVQSNAVNQRLQKFQEEVKQKLEGLKNKKVKSSEIDKYYSDVQNKMKSLQKIVDTAFQELKARSQHDTQKQKGSLKNESKLQDSQLTHKSNISRSNISKNSSNLSDSDVTIQSVELGTKSKVKASQKQMQSKLLDFDQSSSMDSVDSIFIQSNKNFKSKEVSGLGNSSKLDASKLSMKKQEQVGQLDVTLKSEYVQTMKQVEDPFKIRDVTLTHLDEVKKEIMNNPSLILDDTFLNVTLSLSANQLPNQFKSKIGKKTVNTEDSLDKSCSSSGKTINFDFTKKDFQDTLSASSKKTLSEHKSSAGDKDSLDEEYEADFESYEEDMQLDIREQEKKSVKDLFASTLKNFVMKNESGTSNSSINPRNKYSLTLSTIKEQSSEGGSTISYKEDLE